MTIKLTTDQKTKFKEAMKVFSRLAESEDEYLRGEGGSVQAFPYLFKSDSCDIDTEYTEIRWQTIKNFVQKNIAWYADLADKAWRGKQKDDFLYFSGKQGAYEHLLNIMNAFEKGEEPLSWVL